MVTFEITAVGAVSIPPAMITPVVVTVLNIGFELTTAGIIPIVELLKMRLPL